MPEREGGVSLAYTNASARSSSVLYLVGISRQNLNPCFDRIRLGFLIRFAKEAKQLRASDQTSS